MADKTAETGVGFTRCAVCKIDLKGRFVYIDDKIEDLLQCTKEELFGRYLTEFLDDESRDHIDRLLSQRNHYESFFDAVDIKLLAQGKRPTCARVIVSLNFIAGNPVNFQLVCDTAADRSEAAPSGGASPIEKFVGEVLSLEGRGDLKELTAALRQLAGAVQASVYLYDGENLEPRTGSTGSPGAQFDFDSIPAVDELHRNVAETDQPYDFTNQDDVRRAIELVGAAPSEYVAPLSYDPNSRYLLRLTFDETTPAEVVRCCLDDVELGLGLVNRLFGTRGSATDHQDVDVKFTVGFLESLGIGALLTQADGSVVGYNPSVGSMVEGDAIGEDYHQFIDNLLVRNKDEVLAAIEGHFDPDPENLPQHDLRLTIESAGGKTVDLVLVRLVFEPGDYSACFVLIPTAVGPGSGSGDDAVDHDVWTAALAAILARVTLVEKEAGELGHELFDQLGEEGNRSIERLLRSSRQLTGMADDLSRLAEYERSNEEPAETDLKLLFKSVLDRLQPSFPDVAVTTRCSDLPKVVACRNKLKTVMMAIADNCLRYCASDRLALKLTCREEQNMWVVEITDNGPGIPRQYLNDIFEPYFRIPGRRPQSPPGNGRGLALVRALVRSMQGEIEAESDGKSGTTVRIRLPRL